MHQQYVNVKNILNIVKNASYKNKVIIVSLIKKSIKLYSYKKICYFPKCCSDFLLRKIISTFFILIF